MKNLDFFLCNPWPTYLPLVFEAYTLLQASHVLAHYPNAIGVIESTDARSLSIYMIHLPNIRVKSPAVLDSDKVQPHRPGFGIMDRTVLDL